MVQRQSLQHLAQWWRIHGMPILCRASFILSFTHLFLPMDNNFLVKCNQSSYLHVLGYWEEFGESRENPSEHRKHVWKSRYMARTATPYWELIFNYSTGSQYAKYSIWEEGKITGSSWEHAGDFFSSKAMSVMDPTSLWHCWMPFTGIKKCHKMLLYFWCDKLLQLFILVLQEQQKTLKVSWQDFFFI